jgi:hypothetical protein
MTMKAKASNTSDAHIATVLHAAPFADNDAGIPEMCALIRALCAERATAHEALRLIADIAEGSTTWHSLPHIAKLARAALKPDIDR